MVSKIRLVVLCVALVLAPAGVTRASGGEPAAKQPVVIAAAVSADQASQGVQGETGAAGATGATGVTGDVGPKGDQGEPGTNGTNGTNGAQGPTGPAGPAGPAGSGTFQSMRVQGAMVGLGSDGFAHASATCPVGWTLTGGGFRAAGVAVLESFQGPRNLNDPAVNTWFVAAATGFLGSGVFDAWATCARIAP